MSIVSQTHFGFITMKSKMHCFSYSRPFLSDFYQMDSFSTLLYMKIIIRFLTFSVGLRNFSTTILIDSMQGIYRRKILQRIFCYKLIWNGLRQGSEGFLIIKGTSSDRQKVLWTFSKKLTKMDILKTLYINVGKYSLDFGRDIRFVKIWPS